MKTNSYNKSQFLIVGQLRGSWELKGSQWGIDRNLLEDRLCSERREAETLTGVPEVVEEMAALRP